MSRKKNAFYFWHFIFCFTSGTCSFSLKFFAVKDFALDRRAVEVFALDKTLLIDDMLQSFSEEQLDLVGFAFWSSIFVIKKNVVKEIVRHYGTEDEKCFLKALILLLLLKLLFYNNNCFYYYKKISSIKLQLVFV